ncbi:hypothetical protein LY78DRAFT_664810 [Colletotrichum sublineola]|nr:hypothetical protein LY78DRAFT_664810 [Colletotrichum sublineola]
MFSTKTFAILALAAAFLPATQATCYLGCKYLNEEGKWIDVTHTAKVGDTFYINGHSTKIGNGCKPVTTTWSDADIYSW